MGKRGFTLLEVIIAVVVLTSITVLTARMIQRGVEYKRNIQGRIDRYSSSREVLGLMARDLGAAFNYRDINVVLYNAAQKERAKKRGGSTPPPTGSGGQDNPPPPGNPELSEEEAARYREKEVIIYTHFVGEADNLHFTTLNHFRATRNSAQSNQAEVGYFLKNCRSRRDKNKSSQCLWRRASPYLDQEVKEGGNEQPILENVKSLKLRYLTNGEGEDVWKDSWTSSDAESATQNQFPVAVEITLVTQKEKDKELALTIVAPIRFPNNPPQTAEEEVSGTN